VCLVCVFGVCAWCANVLACVCVYVCVCVCVRAVSRADCVCLVCVFCVRV